MSPIYRPSGRFAPIAALAPLALVATTAALGFAYSYASLWLPVVSALNLLLLIAFAGLVAVATELLLRATHVRSRPLGVLLALLGGVASVYFAWAGFAHARLAPDGLSLRQALDPGVLVALAVELGRSGSYEVNGVRPVGAALHTSWLLEAALLIGLPAWFARALPSAPYCESCRAWTQKAPPVLWLASDGGADVKRAFERLDLVAITALEPQAPGQGGYVLQPWRCPRCRTFATLSLQRGTLGDDGGPSGRVEDVVRWRIVTAAELEALVAIREAMAEVRASGA